MNDLNNRYFDNQHIYYRCTKKVDPNYPEKYINEKDLRPLVKEFIEQNVKDVGINDKLRSRVEKHYSVTQSLLTHYKVDISLVKPLIEYARYALDKRAFNEMLGLAERITTKLNFKDGRLEFIPKSPKSTKIAAISIQ